MANNHFFQAWQENRPTVSPTTNILEQQQLREPGQIMPLAPMVATISNRCLGPVVAFILAMSFPSLWISFDPKLRMPTSQSRSVSRRPTWTSGPSVACTSGSRRAPPPRHNDRTNHRDEEDRDASGGRRRPRRAKGPMGRNPWNGMESRASLQNVHPDAS